MTWYPLDTWIVIVGALCAIACALPGCFLLLRQMSMMGDAISHAVLPGLALAFLVTGSRASLPLFIGAALTGILTALLTQWIHRWGDVDRGAAMGIVFTSLFAVGLILITRAAERVDLDPGCVLYGAIELTPLDVALQLNLAGIPLEIPRAALVLGSVALLNLLLILVFYKEYKITAFDPGLASTQGIHAGFMHYLLMTQVAVTTVAAFEAVGSILVIAMLIVPAATAQLLTRRLAPMLWCSALIGVLAAGLGHLLALKVPGWLGYASTSTAGMMAVALGLLFLVALLWTQLQRLRAHAQPAGAHSVGKEC
jgi:manganese/zinc/iron transport system permease protein